jgi:hypothetical protein
MAVHSNKLEQVEGQWEELIQHPDQFAGRRVRVTVISDERSSPPCLLNEVRRWLAEGERLDVTRATPPKTDAFGDLLIEKFRKQGLVL